MKSRFLLFLSILLSFLVTSCTENRRVRSIMMDFIDSEIVIPNDLACIQAGNLTKIDLDSLKQNKYIIYYDSLDCSSCRVGHLMDIYPLYQMADTMGFSVLTIFAPRLRDLDEIKLQLMVSQHPFPVYIDLSREFTIRNREIPLDSRFHCFLIDNEGKPLLVGNPLYNEKILDLLNDILQH